MDKLTVQGDVYEGHEDDQSGGTSNTSGENVLGRWSRRFSDTSDLSLQSYLDRTHLLNPVAPLSLGALQLAGAGLLQDDLTTYDVDFQHRFRIGAANGIVWGWGFRYTHDVVSNAPALAFLPPTLDRDLYSIFAQDEVALRPDLSLTVGSKLERNDYTGFEVEPNVRLSWLLNSNQALWSAISRAVRTPSRIDQDVFEAAPPHFVLLEGGSHFTSESVVAYELGYRVQIEPQLSASVSSFFNHYNDVRSTTITPTTLLPFFFANGLEGDTYGLEFSGNYQVSDSWSMHAGYTLLKEHLHVKPGQIDINDALNETADPQHQFSLRSSFNLPRHTEFDTALRWVDTLHTNNGPVVGTVPSYFELDTHLAWHASDRLEFALVGQNLLHNRHPEFGFPEPSRPEIERSAYGKFTWRY
jgi:iron complex outermembrane receptor protein